MRFIIFSKQKSLADLIIRQLEHGQILILDLIKLLSKIRPGTTKQGVYAALRTLKKGEIVVSAKGKVSLNLAWLEQIRLFSQVARSTYLETGSGDIAAMRDGEKIQYVFRDLNFIDAMWTHHIHLLVETRPPEEPFYFHLPHWWFYWARRESEEKLAQFIGKSARPCLFTIGARSMLDLEAVQKVGHHCDNIQCHFLEKRLFPWLNYYVSVIGDFVIEVYIDMAIANAMEKIYQTSSTNKVQAAKLMTELINRSSKNKYTISRNTRKAARLRRKLSKGFVLPRC